MSNPTNLKYTASHEWIRTEADGTLTIGVTDHAQEALGDVVFLELPDAGRKLAAEEACAVIESVKAASDIYAPVAGEVIESNQAAADAPESVNAAPRHGHGGPRPAGRVRSSSCHPQMSWNNQPSTPEQVAQGSRVEARCQWRTGV